MLSLAPLPQRKAELGGYEELGQDFLPFIASRFYLYRGKL